MSPDVAACFASWQGRRVRDQGTGIRAHLVKPLGADVLLALAYRAADSCDSIATCGVDVALAGLKPFAHVHMFPDQSSAELVAQMEQLPHWSKIVAAFNRPGRRKCARNPSWHAADDDSQLRPYNCTGVDVPSNSIFAPVIGGTHQQLPMFRSVEQCLTAIEQHEKANGIAYERIVYSRLDTVWLQYHPPLSMLNAAFVWVPNGEDHYAGVNDRHAVLNRSAANVYLRRWSQIINGSTFAITTGNAEQFLRASLEHHQLRIRRFPNVALLDCCDQRCWTGACYARALPLPSPMLEAMRKQLASAPNARAVDDFELSAAERRAADAAPFRNDAFMVDRLLYNLSRSSTLDTGFESSSATAVAHAASAVLVRGKYLPELARAILHALALSLPGTSYALARGVREREGCKAPFRQDMTSPGRGQHGPLCNTVVVGVPASHERAFRVLVRSLRLTSNAGTMAHWLAHIHVMFRTRQQL